MSKPKGKGRTVRARLKERQVQAVGKGGEVCDRCGQAVAFDAATFYRSGGEEAVFCTARRRLIATVTRWSYDPSSETSPPTISYINSLWALSYPLLVMRDLETFSATLSEMYGE